MPSNPEPHELVRLVMSTNNPDILTEQSTHEDPTIRLAVARNRHTPKSTLSAMHDNECLLDIRVAIASNPAPFTINDFHVFTFDEVPVCAAAMSHEAAPIYLLEDMSVNQYAEVREAVAGNPFTPSRSLEVLAVDPVFEVRLAVHGNRNRPTSVEFLDEEFGRRSSTTTPDDLTRP